MSEFRQYFFPATLATLLHAAIVALFVVGFAWPQPKVEIPLAIQATLVVEQDLDSPPPVQEAPQAEPDPEPLPPEPEPVQPEPDDSARLAAEEAKRQEDLRIEQERIAREEAAAEAERLRIEEEERQRQEAEAERKRQEEAERKRQEEEAERKRQEELEERRRQAEEERQREIERQRQENERKRREAEAAMQAELDAEQRRIDAVNAGAREVYYRLIQQKIIRNWSRPQSARPGIRCTVRVRQLPGGDVLSATVTSCNGDEAVERSIVTAVKRASPLPMPSEPSLFQRDLTLVFSPEE